MDARASGSWLLTAGAFAVLAAVGAGFAWLALGPLGNLIVRETVGVGLAAAVLLTVWRDRAEIAARLRARDALLAAYAFGVVLFAMVGALALIAGAHDIGALTRQ